MTVEDAVIRVVAEHLAMGITKIPIAKIERAHPEHQLSGRARLRGLRQKGIILYRFDDKDNTYEILTSLDDLKSGRKSKQVDVLKQQGKKPQPQEPVSLDDVKNDIRRLMEGL